MFTNRTTPHTVQIQVRSLLFATAVLSISTVALAGGRATDGGGIMVPQPKMGEPLHGLTAAQLAAFELGKIKYDTPITVEEGLGPVFNKNSCGNCHNNPLGGPGSQAVTRFGRDNKGVFDPMTEFGGSLLQVSSINDFCFEEIHEDATIIEPRITNGALAYGLVEAIPDDALLAVRDAQPLAQRGVAHMVGAFEDPPKSPLRVGRFGHKAQVATVLTFSADAALNEIGLTNRFITVENDPNGDLPPSLGSPDFCDTVADPEDGPDNEGLDFIDHVTTFQRLLAPFPQTPKSGMAGEGVFNDIGCNVCHAPSFTTSANRKLEDSIRNKVIRPYSDFLLHNMGLAGDPIVQGDATEQMVRTPPLWGIVVRDPIWHNGEIGGGSFQDRMLAAIENHRAFGSQGKPSGDAFMELSTDDQNAMIAFLGSLGQAEFDSDLNNQIDIDDFTGQTGGVSFGSCFTGNALGTYSADHACAIHDIDQDGDVDMDDFNSFMLVFEGQRRDCNGNGELDLREILLGLVVDANNNGIPDSCEPTCESDVNGTGTINVDDLLAVINQWGPCPSPVQACGADITGDLVVNANDLLSVINSWGTCN